MSYKLFLEGQIIDLSDDVAATDDTLRTAFVPFFPELGTADIKRQEKDGITEIRMVKRAGTKGNAIMQSLIDSKMEINPALELTWQLKKLERSNSLSIKELISFQEQINSAIDTGETWEKSINHSLESLNQCRPIPSLVQVTGI